VVVRKVSDDIITTTPVLANILPLNPQSRRNRSVESPLGL